MRPNDFELIASVFKYADQSILFGPYHPIAAYKVLRNDMADMLLAVHPKFDVERFLTACELIERID